MRTEFPPPADADALAWAHPVVKTWFLQRFGSYTEPQEQGWPSIAQGRPTLISAPTGSGKTLAAFLIAIDSLLRQAIAGTLQDETEIVYVSPLKALSNDVQKNLQEPLREIQECALNMGYLCPEIRTGVRTGDTLPAERRAMLKRPPHILVTTPESLYILLTAEKSRQNLRRVRTVIVDEIHALADSKRGSHLTLTLERLDALICAENRLAFDLLQTPGPKPLRIGLSATQNPIDAVAEFLTGTTADKVSIIQVGQRRNLDLAVEVPGEELSSVASNSIWDSIYDRLAVLAQEHCSTLVFVNTRAKAERLAFQLGERLGAENVAAHHGSLSRKIRLEAERKLKCGEIRLLVATSSLELGIDIGFVDLVCQINSPRVVAAAMQRVGRAGHWRGATPKGRFFATTRDDLVECAALVQAMRSGQLDRLILPDAPLDVLMQQMVAACSAEPWREEDLFAVFKRAYPYRDLTREEFEELIVLLSEGIESSRGRYGAYLMRDRVHGVLQSRRGARTTAISNGGTIPETALFSVITQPEELQIATLDEDFAIDSSAGDIILLGNTSWRILRIEGAGRVYVEDAHGEPPTVPFWRGEALPRTLVLSGFVSELRQEIGRRVKGVLPGYISQSDPEVAETVAWLKEQCCVCDSGAEQLISYIVTGRAILGSVPGINTIVAERFFDEGGGMQLVLHAPFGGKINKAWGLSLRKRFCRGFNFELQASASENGLTIALAEQHSFPLSDVFHFLTEETVTSLLEQASLASPIFKARWRWSAGRALQLLRMSKGKKIAPQVQRTRAEDLLASVFPQAAACFENIEGDIQIPNHPLVREVMKDVLAEAMDLEGLRRVLAGIRSGAIQCLAIDTATPSAFAHELLNANPNDFLDEAPLEERRARAVSLRGVVPDSLLGEAGRLDPEAIREIRTALLPDFRDEHELHDLLCALFAVPVDTAQEKFPAIWRLYFERLVHAGRASYAWKAGVRLLVPAESVEPLRLMCPELSLEQGLSPVVSAAQWTKGEASRKAVLAWMHLLGPTTAQGLAGEACLDAREVYQSMLELEMSGVILRGVFENLPLASPEETPLLVEWCERHILQRIHRRTIQSLRKQISPVTPAAYMKWLLHWQHLGAQAQLSGEQGLLEALRQLQGFEAPAIEWERTILPRRISGYDPRWLDTLCLMGVVGWGRFSPHPAFESIESGGPRRVIPTGVSPITFFLREEAQWMDLCLKRRQIPEEALSACLTPLAQKIRHILSRQGAMFAADLIRQSGEGKEEVCRALWELVAAGLITADGFDSLRLLIDPRRKTVMQTPSTLRGSNRLRNMSGRWSLFCSPLEEELTSVARIQQQEAELESACRMLLTRYGVVFRDLLQRETAVPKWRELQGLFRRLEARGEIRGGRFVSGVAGEQFALPEAVASLREYTRETSQLEETTQVAAADPMNLVGIVVPGERVAAVPGKHVVFRNGAAFVPESDREKETLSAASASPLQLSLSQSKHDDAITI